MYRDRLCFWMLAVAVAVWSAGCSDSRTDLSTAKSIILAQTMYIERPLGTGELKPDAELWVIAQLQHLDSEVRWKACMVLGDTSSRAAATALYLVARTDPDHKTQFASRYGLSCMGALGRRFLVYLLRSGDRNPFTIAAYAKSCKADLLPYSGPGLDLTINFDPLSSPKWWDEKGRSIFENEKFEDPINVPPPSTGPPGRVEDYFPNMSKKE